MSETTGAPRTFSNHIMVRPQDMNHAGTLFGGTMMAWADELAYVAASLTYPGCTFVTKIFREFDFNSGAREGEIIRIDARVAGKGRSSVRVEVEGVNSVTGELIFSTCAVMVNAKNGKSLSIPEN